MYYAVDPSVGAYLEAETFTSKVGPLFHSFSDASRSNGAGMETTDNGASTASATGATDYLTYNLQVTNGGTVNVYLLSTGPDGDSDSVWLNVDGGTDQQVTTGSTGTWVWKKPSATFSLPTGTHTLTIKNREDGAQVDKIYITTGSTAPTGLGGTALTPQFGSVVSGWLAAYHPSEASDTVLATSGLDLGSTVLLGRRAGSVADAPQARVPAMPATSLSRTLTYQYDGLLRLTGATTSGAATATYSYTYDLGGNRTSATVNGTTTTRTYNAANQVTGWTYDNVGNLISDGTTTYGYDALNRQISTGATTNAYNGDGVLVQQGATRYTQDLVAPLSQILGDGTQTYVYGRERLYGQAGTAKTWYASDALGSVRYTMDAAGTPSTPITYDPWGAVTSGSVPTFGFTGELQQGGLVDLRARWYSTGEGRFGSRDPFAGADEQPYSLHSYQYGFSDPVLYTDPSGRDPWWNGDRDPRCPVGWYWVQRVNGCLPGIGFPPPSNLTNGDDRQPQPDPATKLFGGSPKSPTANPEAIGEGGYEFPDDWWKTIGIGSLLALLCASTYDNVISNRRTTDDTPESQTNSIIVELGPGGVTTNLVTLAVSFPRAKVYGIDADPLTAIMFNSVAQGLDVADRIEIITGSYATYVGPLQHKADIVVAVAPNPRAPILAGIRNFIRPGGKVLVLTDQRDIAESLAQEFGGRAIVRTVGSTIGKRGSLQTVTDTSLGIPLSSTFYDIAEFQPWEIFVPSW